MVQGSYMYLPRFRFFLYLALISQFWSYSKAGYLLHARVIAFNSLDIIMSILTYMHHFPDKSHGIPELIFINFDCLDLCRVTASEATTVAGLWDFLLRGKRARLTLLGGHKLISSKPHSWETQSIISKRREK